MIVEDYHFIVESYFHIFLTHTTKYTIVDVLSILPILETSLKPKLVTKKFFPLNVHWTP